jgi:hypothetical protein
MGTGKVRSFKKTVFVVVGGAIECELSLCAHFSDPPREKSAKHRRRRPSLSTLSSNHSFKEITPKEKPIKIKRNLQEPKKHDLQQRLQLEQSLLELD